MKLFGTTPGGEGPALHGLTRAAAVVVVGASGLVLSMDKLLLAVCCRGEDGGRAGVG